MSDLRSRGGIPYGYRIVSGKPKIDEVEANQLRSYFSNYLEGFSMAESARLAGLPCKGKTLPNLFYRKEYSGNGTYPAIITKEEQADLINLYGSQKKSSSSPAPRKHVPIYTEFTLDMVYLSKGSLLQDITELYESIRPTTLNLT